MIELTPQTILDHMNAAVPDPRIVIAGLSPELRELVALAHSPTDEQLATLLEMVRGLSERGR
jgi:hypothetical protein